MAQGSQWDRFLAAIRAQESGGNYTEDTGGCLGAYCWNDMGTWGGMARAAGESRYANVNPSQVPAQVQDKVASANLHRIYQQAGGGTSGLAAAARWWNGGSTASEANPGLPAQPWARHCGGGTSAAYACQVLARMGLGGHYLAGAGSGAGGTVTLTAAEKADCALSIPSWHVNLFFGLGPTVGGQCLLTKSQVRAMLAVGVLASAAPILGVGLALVAVWSGPGRRVVSTVTAVIPGMGPVSAGARAAGAAVGATGGAAAEPDRMTVTKLDGGGGPRLRRGRELPPAESSRERAARYTRQGNGASADETGF